MREGEVPGPRRPGGHLIRKQMLQKGGGGTWSGAIVFCSEEKANAQYVETATKDERQKKDVAQEYIPRALVLI